MSKGSDDGVDANVHVDVVRGIRTQSRMSGSALHKEHYPIVRVFSVRPRRRSTVTGGGCYI